MSWLEKIFKIGSRIVSMNPVTDEVEEGEVVSYVDDYWKGVVGVNVKHSAPDGDPCYMELDSYSADKLNS